MMQYVDPFIPITKSPQPATKRPFPELVNNIPRPTKQPLAIDNVVLRRTVVRPVQPPVHRQQAVAAPKENLSRSLKSPAQNHHRIWAKLQLPIFMISVVLAGFLVQQSVLVGEVLLVAYGIFAFTRHIASRTTFLLALIVFAGIILLLIFKTSDAVAANFAVYAFLLLAIGVITLGHEVRTA